MEHPTCQPAAKRSGKRSGKTTAATKSAKLRAIAPLPFKGTLAAKDIDAAIKTVMARRSAKAKQAVRSVAVAKGPAPAKAARSSAK